jgi:hypothetical protein
MATDWAHLRESGPVVDGAVRVEPADEASSLMERLRSTFIDKSASTFWWDHLTRPSRSFKYSDGQEGLRLLAQLLAGSPSELHLVLPSDEPQVHVATGLAADLIAALADCPFMESVVFPTTAEWAVFDNHHNVLVVVGEPPGLDP